MIPLPAPPVRPPAPAGSRPAATIQARRRRLFRPQTTPAYAKPDPAPVSPAHGRWPVAAHTPVAPTAAAAPAPGPSGIAPPRPVATADSVAPTRLSAQPMLPAETDAAWLFPAHRRFADGPDGHVPPVGPASPGSAPCFPALAESAALQPGRHLPRSWPDAFASPRSPPVEPPLHTPVGGPVQRQARSGGPTAGPRSAAPPWPDPAPWLHNARIGPGLAPCPAAVCAPAEWQW